MELLLLAMFAALVVIILVPNEIWKVLFWIGGVLLFGTIAYWCFLAWIITL